MVTVIECRELAKFHRQHAKAVDILLREAHISNNIARTLTALATQLEMLDDCVRDDRLRPRIVAGTDIRGVA